MFLRGGNQQLQSMLYRRRADGGTIAGEKAPVGDDTAFRRDGEAHCPHRFFRTTAAGAGDTGYRHREICRQTLTRPLRHRGCTFGRYGAEISQRLSGNSEQPLLDLIAVTYDSAVENRAGTGNGGNRMSDPATSA